MYLIQLKKWIFNVINLNLTAESIHFCILRIIFLSFVHLEILYIWMAWYYFRSTENPTYSSKSRSRFIFLKAPSWHWVHANVFIFFKWFGEFSFSSIFFLKNNFIYFWLCWVFIAVWAFLLSQQAESTLSLWCVGFSLHWLLLRQSSGSRVLRLQ